MWKAQRVKNRIFGFHDIVSFKKYLKLKKTGQFTVSRKLPTSKYGWGVGRGKGVQKMARLLHFKAFHDPKK
jgi:hypothetical protein